MWRSWKQVWTPVAWNCESTCWAFMVSARFRIRSRSASRATESIDQLVELVVAHEAAHGAVVDQHHRRIGAGAEAFALLQREQAVGRGAAHLDAQLLLQVRKRRGAVAQLARQV